ncbi:MAG: hypothetical protein KF829_05880 [Ferruginibacter sp.]|nr:hypothetical protein [Ferruginibacter sp.]
MGAPEIITIIISSSVLAAILTGFVNLRIQNLNYKREYYKKLIERRIDAQEQILNLTNELRIQVKLDEGVLCNRLCATGEQHFKSISILVAASVNISFWLSNELSNILLDFNIFLLNEINHEIKGINQIERDKSLQQLGIKNHNQIRDFRSKIEQQLMKDFANLTEIKTFVESKNKTGDKLYLLKN